jgi:cytidylate kinase
MNTNENFVITISRELGSGGRTVGRKLAAALNVRYSDKELVEQLMQQFNLTTGGIEQLKGKKKRWISDFITFVAPVPKISMLVDTDSRYVQEFRPDLTTDDVYKAEAEILKGIADEGSCVIAGRSGFFVLKDHPNKLDIFITASMEHRIERVMRKQHLSREEAAAAIESVDKARDNYVQRYTGKSRNDARNYDLCLSMDNLSEDDAVELILSYIKYTR